MCRELTKKFEEVMRGTLGELAELCSERPLKGEIVVLIDRGDKEVVSDSDLETALRMALQTLSVRDAANQVSAQYSLPRRKVYQQALAMSKEA